MIEMKAIIQLKDRPAPVLTDRMPSGLCSFIGWQRLAEEVLRESGNIRKNETVTHFVVTERGITFYLETK